MPILCNLESSLRRYIITNCYSFRLEQKGLLFIVASFRIAEEIDALYNM